MLENGITGIKTSKVSENKDFFLSNIVWLLSKNQECSRFCTQWLQDVFHWSHFIMVKCGQYPVKAQQS